MGNHCFSKFHSVAMKQFVTLLAVVGSSLAAPAADPQLLAAAPYINQGSASGPLTPAVGGLVATPKGYRSLALEGFSEDLNQDGFVDPIGQAVVPVVHHAPVVAAAAVAAYHAAPVAVATAPVVQHVGYNVHHTVQHVPQVAVQKHVTTHTTHHVINHAPVVGAFTGLLPAVAPVAGEDEAPAVEEA